MGCGCNKGTTGARRYDGTAKQEFSLVLRDGTVQRYGSRLEADAANARAGYTGIVKPVGS